MLHSKYLSIYYYVYYMKKLCFVSAKKTGMDTTFLSSGIFFLILAKCRNCKISIDNLSKMSQLQPLVLAGLLLIFSKNTLVFEKIRHFFLYIS